VYWIIAGDIHENATSLQRIPGVGGAEGLLLSGDMTNKGGAAQVDRVLECALAVNTRVLAQVGNMDEPSVTEHLTQRGMNLHRQAVVLTPGLVAMGVGWSTPTPFGTPSEASEEQMRTWLEETHAAARTLLAQQGTGAKLIAVIHTPPHGTKLDELGNGVHVGSSAVRDFLLHAQPDVCVCGHIHEAYGQELLGQTVVLNPGMAEQGGYVRVDFVEGTLTAHLGKA